MTSGSGLSRDKVVFVSVCAVAIGVAAVCMTAYLIGDDYKPPAASWQCLACGNTFDIAKAEELSVSCPECGKPAIRLVYDKCLRCRKDVLTSRFALTAAGQESYAQIMAELSGREARGLITLRLLELPKVFQYRLEKPDGGYEWSEWIADKDPERRKLEAALKCPECGEYLKRGAIEKH